MTQFRKSKDNLEHCRAKFTTQGTLLRGTQINISTNV